MPIPVSTVTILDKDNSQPFPCQSCNCGCKTAEQCWTNCCCFTPAERFAWAEKNGVTPPSYAQRPASDETASEQRSSITKVGGDSVGARSTCCEPRKACCEKHANKTVSSLRAIVLGKLDCFVATATPSRGSCCQTEKADNVEPKALKTATKRKIVLSMFALKCQGKSSSFTLLPWTILTTIQKVVMFAHEFGPSHQATIRDPAPVFYAPDTPPPKQMLS